MLRSNHFTLTVLAGKEFRGRQNLLTRSSLPDLAWPSNTIVETVLLPSLPNTQVPANCSLSHLRQSRFGVCPSSFGRFCLDTHRRYSLVNLLSFRDNFFLLTQNERKMMERGRAEKRHKSSFRRSEQARRARRARRCDGTKASRQRPATIPHSCSIVQGQVHHNEQIKTRKHKRQL